MRTGRNEACPCGSGSKFKNCCAGKQKLPRGLVLLIGAIAAIGAVGLLPALISDREAATGTSAASAVPARRLAPQPGPAPAGKVWSPEHGHWHDVTPPGGASPVQVVPSAAPAAAAPPATPVPQPPGPAPEGKVWSPEHGHWHDAPAQ